MVATDPGQAQAIGRCWVAAVDGRSVVQRAWVQTHDDRVELWLLTAPIDFQTELGLYEAGTAVNARFPDARVRFHVLNPSNDEGPDIPAVPANATEIPLRPA